MILVIAPYSPPNRHGLANLGASSKIETILSVLSKLDSEIVLVNSAHNCLGADPIRIADTMIGTVRVREITPALSRLRAAGKLKNLFFMKSTVDLLSGLKPPILTWFYNTYAFEMRLAGILFRKYESPMILEYEDWHFARRRGLSLKPYFDCYFWRKSAPLFSGAFAVNTQLKSKLHNYPYPTFLLPGVVPKALSEIATSSPPFCVESTQINVGFFSGLSEEKGAGIVLQLVKMLPSGYRLHVTGAGPFSQAFEVLQREMPSRLQFYGRVSLERLYTIIADCDVILNPHTCIRKMDDGVFPFKVIEAIASGRQLVSTALPTDDLETVLQGVTFVGHSPQEFLVAILNAKTEYLNNKEIILRSAANANDSFGEDALYERISMIISRGSLSERPI